MNSKVLSQVKKKLSEQLKNKEIIDIIIFGSVIKGKANPKDIDIAIITENPNNINEIKGFHISNISPKEFFMSPPSIVNTLFREGYSIKNNKFLAEIYKFSSRIMFKYSLTKLNPSKKVQLVNVLRGTNKEQGLVKENKGEWISNQVFIVPVQEEYIFEKLFLNFQIEFKKYYLLIH